MKRAIVILLCIAMLAALFVVPGYSEETADPAEPVLHHAYIHGTSDGLFMPQSTMTRAEFAQMIWNLQADPVEGICVFSDVADGDWYAAEMYNLARRLGYYQATAISGRFNTNQEDHGWAELPINGVTYILEPEINSTRFPSQPGKLFLITYTEAPFSYWK